LLPGLSRAASLLRERCRNACTEAPDELFLSPEKDVDGCKLARIQDSTGYVLGGAALAERCTWYGRVLSFQLFTIISGREILITPREAGQNIADIVAGDKTTAMHGWTRKWSEPLTLSCTTPDQLSSLLIWSDSFVLSDSNVHLIQDSGPVHHLPLAESRIFPSTFRWNGDLSVLACLLFVRMKVMPGLWSSFS
jgi:hypothetical protein